MSATYLCRSVVVSVNIFLPDRFVCELTFDQLSVGGLSHNVRKDPKMHKNYLLNIVQFCDDPPKNIHKIF